MSEQDNNEQKTVQGSSLALQAGYVLQEAVEKLLSLPEMHPCATDDELEDAVENGFSPDIREHAEAVLLARNALRITGSLFPHNSQDK